MRSYIEIAQRLSAEAPTTIVGATPAEVEELAMALRYPMPTDLAAWLAVCNGCSVNAWSLLGTHRQVHVPSIADVIGRSWPHDEWIPVALDDFGNPYCLLCNILHNRSSVIGYINGTSGDIVECVVASNLQRFVDVFSECMLQGSDNILYDQEYMLRHDPELGDIHELKLPWA